MDRFVPLYIDNTALHKSKSVFTGEDIDLFNDSFILQPSSNTNMFNEDSLQERNLLNNDTMFKKMIKKNHKKKIDHDFQHKYLKIHGQKHWINLKESFNNKKSLSDIFNIYQNTSILHFSKNIQNGKNKHINFQNILTTDHKKDSENLLNLEPFKVLDAPDLKNDFYSNLLSWSKNDKLVVGLNDSIYLWSQSDSETTPLLSSKYLNQFRDIITCVSYSPSLNEDLICCGTKHGRVLILCGSNFDGNSINDCISMIPDNEEFRFLLCESVANSKGICSIKWFLKGINQETNEEEWSILCGNESGEVICFDLYKVKEKVQIDNGKTRILSQDSAKSTESNLVISTMRDIHMDFTPFTNDSLENIHVANDTLSLSNSNTNILSINDLNVYINTIFNQNGIENMNSGGNIFLRTENNNSFRNNNDIFLNYDVTNVSINNNDSTPNTTNLSHIKNKKLNVKKTVTTKIMTKTKYVLDLKSYIKCQTQQLCGMDLSCKYDKSNTKLISAQLAVGGNDNSCTIWDITNLKSPKLKFDLQHTAAVKAVLFCPWLKNLLATGGGSKDRFIRIWHTQTGKIIKQYKTAGQITSLIWSRHKMELMLTFGFGNPDQSVLMKTFKYPSMKVVNHIKTVDHIRVLSSALSPDHSTIALATNDETIKFFKISSKNKTVLQQCHNKDVYQRNILNLREAIEIFDTLFTI